MNSPYYNAHVNDWKDITTTLVSEHPLDANEIVEIVLESWDKILFTKIAEELQIGVDITLSPQIMGSFLHDVIPVMLSRKYPNVWRKESSKNDKDLVFVPDDFFSIEIKTSSQNKIFGNRSYGQDVDNGKKKFGFYLAINFEKFGKSPSPEIKRIKFGWLDHSDWKAQKSASGQNSTLDNDAWNYKLLEIYSK